MVVPYRDEDEKRHLRVMGDLGQIIPMVGNEVPKLRTRRLNHRNGMLAIQIRFMNA